MLYLDKPASKVLDDYFNRLLPLIKSEIANPTNALSTNLVNYLTDDCLGELIKSEPAGLLRLNNDINCVIVPDFCGNDLNTSIKLRRKAYAKLTPPNKGLVDKYKNWQLQLEKVFNYDKFISKNKELSYWLADKLNRYTCTYCNRLYTNTILKKKSKANGIARPQFDHWFSKSQHPAIAISFYNLIPSCSVCNSSIKRNLEFKLNTHIHPYIKESNESFIFSFESKTTHTNNVTIVSYNGTKMANFIDDLKILDVYNAHSEFELKDLIELRHKYSENYLSVLFNDTFSNLNIPKDEAYRLIFGVEHLEKDFHKRPFSKFKKDILQELGIVF